MAIDETRLNDFMGRFVQDLGAVLQPATAVVGDKLALSKSRAQRGYAQYHAASVRFSMSEEQAFALAVEGSPAFIPGAFQIAVAQFKAIPKMAQAFRTGLGLGWHEHDVALFHGTERFFRPGYAAHLVSSWIPALDGMDKRLQAGARVADVGCGHGASTIIMAEAFPASQFVGFDYHEPSIAVAREAANKAG